MNRDSQALELRRKLLLYDQIYSQNWSEEQMAGYYKEFFFALKNLIQEDYQNSGSCEYIDSILQNGGECSTAGRITYVEAGVLFILSLSLRDRVSYTKELNLKASNCFPYGFSGRHYVSLSGRPVLVMDSFKWCRWQNGGGVMSSHPVQDILHYAKHIKDSLSIREQPAPTVDSGRIPIDGPDRAPVVSAAPAQPPQPVPSAAPAQTAPQDYVQFQQQANEILRQARQRADDILRQARQRADQLRADAEKEAKGIRQEATEIRQKAENEAACTQKQLSMERDAINQERAELRQQQASLNAEAEQRVEEAVRTQLIERRAQLRSQWAEEDAREATNEEAASAALDRSKQDLCEQIDQLKISWRKDMTETIQRMESAQQNLEASLRRAKDSLYLQERKPLAECYPQLYALLQGRAISNLQIELSSGNPDPEVIRQNLETLLKSLETYQRKLGKAFNRLGMYAIIPSAGTPYNDITQETIDGQIPDDPDRAVVTQCIRPGVYFQPEGSLDDSLTLVRALVRLDDTEVNP